MDKKKVQRLYELTDRLSKVDVNTLSAQQLAERNLMIAELKKQAVAMKEGSSNIGSKIKAVYQKIYNQGDDAIEFMYNDSPIFAQYWDEYEGDLDSIIAEVDPKELQIIYSELASAVEEQGITEAEGDPKGVDHLSKELLQHIVQQVGSEGAHAIIKSLTWGDGAAKELLHLIVKDLEQNIKQGVAEGSDNITAVFSGYGNYMKGRGANVFKHYGITILDEQYFEDEDIVEYTVSGSKEALDQARAYLERSDQFGGMILKQGVAEAKKPSPKLTPVDIKKSQAVSEEINKEAYERLQKVFAFKNYES